MTFFASRENINDNREAQYTVVGASNDSVLLNPANNVSTTVSTTLKPDGSGNITVTISAGPNNNSSSGFYYLGSVVVTTSTNTSK